MAVSVLIGMQGRNIAIAFRMMIKKLPVVERVDPECNTKDFVVIECNR